MKRCGHCGKPALSLKTCTEHGEKWCMNCGKHDTMNFRNECGQNMGITMTTSKDQTYSYCHRCYREKLDHGFDLEQSYNRLETERRERLA